MGQLTLTQQYCIDACAILDFWRPQRPPYDVRVKKFRSLWDHISDRIEKEIIVLPKAVAEEVLTENAELDKWLKEHKSLFVKNEDCVSELGKVVQMYDIYTKDKASLPDAILVAVAISQGLTVITSEKHVPVPSPYNPKIPNVCEDFTVSWMNLPGFFAAEGL